jgi:hypothetical protein
MYRLSFFADYNALVPSHNVGTIFLRGIADFFVRKFNAGILLLLLLISTWELTRKVLCAIGPK